MKAFLTLQQKIAPEIIDLLERRYTILRMIAQHQPMGRRSVATKLDLGERIVRADIDLLKGQGYVRTDQTGVWLTDEGEEAIESLAQLMRKLWGLQELESSVCRRLGIQQAVIVPGDADRMETVKGEMGRVAAQILFKNLVDGNTIAISGGSTALAVAEAMPQGRTYSDVMVVPARGGLGEQLEEQANHIAAKLAQRIGGQYRMLHVPDNLSQEVVQALFKEPSIAEVLDIIKDADIVVHGIGNAAEMAGRRGYSDTEIGQMLQQGAAGEALGDYFDDRGQVIKHTNSIGLRLEHLDSVKSVLAVAGGTSKARAIAAVVTGRDQLTLVTDEAAAKGILNL